MEGVEGLITHPLVLSVVLILLLLFPLLLALTTLIFLLLGSTLLFPLALLLESVWLESTHPLIPLLWLIVHKME